MTTNRIETGIRNHSQGILEYVPQGFFRSVIKDNHYVVIVSASSLSIETDTSDVTLNLSDISAIHIDVTPTNKFSIRICCNQGGHGFVYDIVLQMQLDKRKNYNHKVYSIY